MHVALWVLAATSLVGTAVCLLRPAHVGAPAPTPLNAEGEPAIPAPAIR
jgi:hypothetical protein